MDQQMRKGDRKYKRNQTGDLLADIERRILEFGPYD
jgi:hypothetical protein